MSTDTIQHGGRTFRLTIEADPDMGPPWVEHAGHGPVEERSFEGYVHCPTAPGEVVLYIAGRSTAWVYDVQKAQQIALRDGWGISDEVRREQLLRGQVLTRRRVAAIAVQADMDYLRGWLRGDWSWVYIMVTLLDADGDLTVHFESMGGLDYGLPESDAYIDECARELADEILHTVTGSVT